ncbi:insulin-degrading enzyme isoform X2 [Zootermopsis nevadensis]|nr:insulin-degrading enzyme isoform X2 [Zootermopsis nevadensis]
MKGVKRCVNDIIKSAEDKRLYRCLELQNDMKVLLISDSSTDKSSASLDVNVGHMSDPSRLPGLAHFCEHMLFLGTEKYPSENEYSKFLSEHGGGSNACTYSDHTNYYFDVVPEHFGGALDRFAQFFLCPLFTESATEREVNAVNSEHEKNIPNDSWRLDQLEKSTAKKDHAFNKFGTGNKQTLDIIPKENGINVREELLKFHDTWYSSNIMALAILGKESLDELERMSVELFLDVKNKNVTVPRWTEHPFGPEQLQMKGYIVPVKDIRNLNITFPIPDLHEYYKAGPGHYLSHLFGHEGPGSLLSVLRTKGWCNSLVGGARTGSRGFGFFGINVDLTEEGIEHVDDIVKLVFQYVNMLKQDGPKEWIFQEYKDIISMHFRFKDKESPRSYVSNIVHNLHDYPLEEVLSGCFLISDWKPDLIEMVLGYLTPENIRVAVVGQMFEPVSNEVEKWYGTKYKLEKIPESVLDEWRSPNLCCDLKLPPKNEFIPTDFDLMPREETAPLYPVIIQDTPLFRVWFKQDDEFLLPKANLSFEFVSPLAYLDPISCNMTYMFVQLFKDALNEYAYAAELAGMKWELTNTKYGMILGIGGYNSKQHVLLDKIMEKLTNFKIDSKRFEILKENYVRGLKNFEAEQPYQHAVYYLAVLLAEQAWTKEELLNSTGELTLEKVEAFIPQILSKMHIECLIHGNADRQKALSLVHLVEERLQCSVSLCPLLPRQLLRNRELQLVDGCHYVFEVGNRLHRSSCTEIYYQCHLQSTHTNMLLELLVQIIGEPCFNILRTKEQLGYIVFSGIRRSNGVQGLRVIVQSERHPSYVDQRVEAFLAKMEEYIVDMTSEEFERHKEALAAQRLEKPKKLSVLSARFWSEITLQQYHFDRANIEVAHLRTLQKKDILNFFKELIDHEAPCRHKLAVHVVPTADGVAGRGANVLHAASDGEVVDGFAPPPPGKEPTKIEDITDFKSSQGMFPLVQPYISLNTNNTKSKL